MASCRTRVCAGKPAPLRVAAAQRAPHDANPETMYGSSLAPMSYEHVVDVDTLLQLRRIALFERVFGEAQDSQLARTLALFDLEIERRASPQSARLRADR